MNNLNNLAKSIHKLARCKGWHDDDKTLRLYINRSCNGLHGDVVGIWEACCVGVLQRPCHKATKMESPLTRMEESYADIIIHALDDSVELGIDIANAVRVKHAYNKTRPNRYGGK